MNKIFGFGLATSPLCLATSHSGVCEFPRLAPSAHDFMEGIEGAVRRAKQDLQAAQNCLAQRVNAHRRELKFNPGDKVLLSTKNPRQPSPAVKKLNPSYINPFEVNSMIGNVAELPQRMDSI